MENEAIPFTETVKTTWMLAEDSELIWQEGTEGIQENRYEITYRNGEEVSRTLLDSVRIKEPIEKIILKGIAQALDTVDEKQQTITVGGETYAYSKAVNVTATAYTCEGLDYNTTFTGTTARVGAIAVDPKVIPLNSKLYIAAADGTWFYGFAAAEDTGGFIKGKRIDLYFDTKNECIEFGRQATTVYILE